MQRFTGLSGWISYNNRRTALLFLCFVLAFHVLAAVLLFIPLTSLDEGHAPVFDWGGYLLRYGMPVTLAGAGLFLYQFWWHEDGVRAQSGFLYLTRTDEPRLHRNVEVLAITAGLPMPRLAVIESPALNAFVCGRDRSSAVLVVTRGLLDGLDDDELAAVIAHELAHISNDDLRLIAAAAVCQRCIAVLYDQSSWANHRYQEAAALGISLFVLPFLFLLFIVISFLRHSAIHLGYITRTLISSTREFVADGEAIRLTKNPSALVSALRKIDGRSLVTTVRAEHDVMLIDGPSTGTFATHPTIAARIEAIVGLIGPMAEIEPRRPRDTRSSGRNVPLMLQGRSRGSAVAFEKRENLGTVVPTSARDGSIAIHADRNWLGFTREMTVAACFAMSVFVVLHHEALARPGVLAELLSAHEFGALLRDSRAPPAPSCNGYPRRADCTEAEIVAEWDTFNSERNKRVGTLAELDKSTGTAYVLPGGVFSTVMPPAVQIATTTQHKCFLAKYKVGDRGLHKIDEPDRRGDISLSRYLGYIDRSLSNISSVGPENRDVMLKSYFTTRKLMHEVVHRFFGEPGLSIVQRQYARSEHNAVVDTIRERLADPAFTREIPAIEQAEYRLLVNDPANFITCVARSTPPMP